MVQALANGPATIAVNVGNAFFAYQSGVMTHSACDGHNNGSINHAIVVVGHGVNGDCDGQSCEYFIVKNSWGVGWGMDGYMKIEATDDTHGACGLYTRAYQPYVSS